MIVFEPSCSVPQITHNVQTAVRTLVTQPGFYICGSSVLRRQTVIVSLLMKERTTCSAARTDVTAYGSALLDRTNEPAYNCSNTACDNFLIFYEGRTESHEQQLFVK